ncbi:peroxidasin homolog [Planococcus citri]|uniref:peroxidasin homolog n=1 Tax=Planococcus citri TaxID=170843 RepID=UPI0031F8352E
MEWKSYVFLVCILVNQVASNCPEVCQCNLYYAKCVRFGLKTVPTDFPVDIQILDLGMNAITNLTRNSFSATPNLETLLLNHNRITTIPNGAFEHLPKLRILHLHRNKISTIEPEAFNNLTNLQELHLHFNNIAKLDNDVFKNSIALQRLFLHYNTLTNVQMDVFASLPNIQNLRLDGNPLNCDCEVFWLVELLRGKNGARVSGTCEQPSAHRSQSLSEITSTQFKECVQLRIITQPKDVEIPESGLPSVTLQCKIRGSPKPSLSWEKDGKKIQSTTNKYELVPDGLVIKSVSQADEGKYQCIGSNNKNDAGAIKSAVVQLKSATKKQKLPGSSLASTPSRKANGTVSPTYVTVTEGKTGQINCTVTADKSIDLIWIKNNATVSKNTFSTNEVNGETFVSTLTLNDIRLEEAGTYQCVSKDTPATVFGSTEVVVRAPPKITKSFNNIIIDSGSVTAELKCVAVGNPTPVVSWYKDNKEIASNTKFTLKENNTVLKIEKATKDDSGTYSCVAKNELGSAEHENEVIIVRTEDSRAPVIIQKPFDMSIPTFSNISLPCKSDGKPQPKIQWLKNNEPIIADDLKFRIQSNGSLNIYNMHVADSGVYKCIASNSLGNETASGTLTVLLEPGVNNLINDEYVKQVVKNATLVVEKAVNATLERVITKVKADDKSPPYQRSIFRYPDEYARNISKCREVFSIAVNLTENYVRKSLNLPKEYALRAEELFTPNQWKLIRSLSGCEASVKAVNCSDTTFHSKYATLDGTCNNLKNPLWGVSYTAFQRLLKPIYSNGIDSPVGWNNELLYHGFARPSPRLISTSLIRTFNVTPDNQLTHMLMQWGQFMDHDLDHAPPSITTQSFSSGVKCSDTCDYDEPCFPIRIPANDSVHPKKPCFEFIRSTSILVSNADDNELPVREQLNQQTAYIDASMVYGFNKERAEQLRDKESNLGLLRGSKLDNSSYLPVANLSTDEVDCKLNVNRLTMEDKGNPGCYIAGDVRVNEMVGLLTMHTVWFREHNKLATRLKEINPHWNSDQLFYEARKILAAELQHITYQHWLPHVIGTDGMQKLGSYQGYNPNTNPGILHVFATAALRMGHTIIFPELNRLDSNFKTIPQGNLLLSKSFFAPWRLKAEGGIDPVMRGLMTMPAKKKFPTQNLNEQIIDHLFENRSGGAMDLAALNIQRSRDHGLPSYAAYRKACNLTEPRNFDELKQDISSDEVRKKMQDVYGHPDNVDVWVGGVLEDQRKGAIIGPLFQCLLAEQFKRVRDGDRFWYENPTTFTPAQLSAIRKITFARILCDIGDNITMVNEDVFTQPSSRNTTNVPCDKIPKLDLTPWLSPKV